MNSTALFPAGINGIIVVYLFTDESYLASLDSSSLSDASSAKDVSEPVPLQKAPQFHQEPGMYVIYMTTQKIPFNTFVHRTTHSKYTTDNLNISPPHFSNRAQDSDRLSLGYWRQ